MRDLDEFTYGFRLSNYEWEKYMGKICLLFELFIG